MEIETSLQAFMTNDFDVLIVTTGHKYYLENDSIYEMIARLDGETIIIDTVGLLDVAKLPTNYSQNTNFHVLGVGHNEKY